MSLFDVVNTTLATKIADALGKYHTGFFTKRVLKTTAEVEANTNPKNLPSALVVGELINDLGGFSFGTTADGKPGYRKPGADAVTPFSSGKLTIDFSYTLSVDGSSGKSETGYGTIILEIEGGNVKSQSIIGSKTMYFVIGATQPRISSITNFQITSVVWD